VSRNSTNERDVTHPSVAVVADERQRSSVSGKSAVLVDHRLRISDGLHQLRDLRFIVISICNEPRDALGADVRRHAGKDLARAEPFNFTFKVGLRCFELE